MASSFNIASRTATVCHQKRYKAVPMTRDLDASTVSLQERIAIGLNLAAGAAVDSVIAASTLMRKSADSVGTELRVGLVATRGNFVTKCDHSANAALIMGVRASILIPKIMMTHKMFRPGFQVRQGVRVFLVLNPSLMHILCILSAQAPTALD
jgi:hypothetical protein